MAAGNGRPLRENRLYPSTLAGVARALTASVFERSPVKTHASNGRQHKVPYTKIGLGAGAVNILDSWVLSVALMHACNDFVNFEMNDGRESDASLQIAKEIF